MPEPEETESNYSYFPVFVDEKEYGMSRDCLYEKLKQNNIYTRRYFYPLISSFKPYDRLPSAKPGNLPVARRKAEEVLCLPLHNGLGVSNIEKITGLIGNYG